MTTVTASRTISMGHRLPSYAGICSSPHGHNVRVEAMVDTRGLFMDFKSVDVWLRGILESMDHAMVLHADDPLVPLLSEFRVVTLSVEPTTEAIAALVYNELSDKLQAAFGSHQIRPYVMEVTVHETDKYSACVSSRTMEVRRGR